MFFWIAFLTGFGRIRELFWRTFWYQTDDQKGKGVLWNWLFYFYNIDVFEGGGFACPHDKGKKSASEFKPDSSVSCLTFLEFFRSHFGSQIRSQIASIFGRLQKGAEYPPPPKRRGSKCGSGVPPQDTISWHPKTEYRNWRLDAEALTRPGPLAQRIYICGAQSLISRLKHIYLC